MSESEELEKRNGLWDGKRRVGRIGVCARRWRYLAQVKGDRRSDLACANL